MCVVTLFRLSLRPIRLSSVRWDTIDSIKKYILLRTVFSLFWVKCHPKIEVLIHKVINKHRIVLQISLVRNICVSNCSLNCSRHPKHSADILTARHLSDRAIRLHVDSLISLLKRQGKELPEPLHLYHYAILNTLLQQGPINLKVYEYPGDCLNFRRFGIWLRQCFKYNIIVSLVECTYTSYDCRQC